MYITITDPAGATYGYDGPPVAMNYRILYEKGNFYGYESLRKKFINAQDLSMFLMTVVTMKAGTYGNLSWVQE